MEPTFFVSQAAFRAWLDEHHEFATELLVGFYKKGSGRPSITWPEAVDEALCFGWIDGVRKGIDEERYSNRFTPRKPRSTWSARNIKRVEELTAQGRMRPAGRKAFQARLEENSGIYSYEQREAATLPAELEAQFEANPAAWAWFQARPPGYRKAAIWWVTSAKKEETRLRRLETLIADSEAGRTVAPLTTPSK